VPKGRSGHKVLAIMKNFINLQFFSQIRLHNYVAHFGALNMDSMLIILLGAIFGMQKNNHVASHKF